MRSTAHILFRAGLVVLSVALAIVAAAIVAPGAKAICNPNSITCGPGDPPPPPPPPPPPKLTISSLSPQFGWTGDNVTMNGTCLLGAQVTVNGITAPILSQTSTKIIFGIPPITGLPVGPQSVPVVAANTCGTASTAFTVTPTLHASGGTTFGVNSQFGQGEDGSIGATLDLDRQSGFSVVHASLTNLQFWSSLSVGVSAALLNGSGTVIGFTSPFTLTANGGIYSYPSTTTTVVTNPDHTEALAPSMTQQVRSARLLFVRDGATALQSTLTNAVQLGQTLASVLSALGLA